MFLTLAVFLLLSTIRKIEDSKLNISDTSAIILGMNLLFQYSTPLVSTYGPYIKAFGLIECP